MNESLNGTPPADGVLAPKRNPWPLIAVAMIALVGIAIAGAFFAARWLAKPAIANLDDVDIAEIDRLAILALNRPDGGPDITAGGKEPLVIPKEYYATVLAPLRGATPIDRDRGIYFGQLQIRLKDGREQIVYLHRVFEDSIPGAVPILQYKVNQKQYEVKPLEKFLKPVSDVEVRIKGG